MVKFLMIGIGGFLGSILRYLVSEFAQKLANNPFFPYGTLTVNVAGCFLIGFLAALSQNKGLFSPNIRMLIMIGFLGGFTTFSTFSNETFALMGDGQFLSAALNIIVSIVLGLLGVWLGYSIANLI